MESKKKHHFFAQIFAQIFPNFVSEIGTTFDSPKFHFKSIDIWLSPLSHLRQSRLASCQWVIVPVLARRLYLVVVGVEHTYYNFPNTEIIFKNIKKLSEQI